MVRENSTVAFSIVNLEREEVLSTAAGMSGNCQGRHHQQRRRSTRFKSVVRRVLVALSFHIGRRHGEPASLPAAAAAQGADDSLEGVDGCGGVIMTSTSTVTTSVCRLAAVEEEQRSCCNTPVSPSANRVNRFTAGFVKALHFAIY